MRLRERERERERDGLVCSYEYTITFPTDTVISNELIVITMYAKVQVSSIQKGSPPHFFLDLCYFSTLRRIAKCLQSYMKTFWVLSSGKILCLPQHSCKSGVRTLTDFLMLCLQIHKGKNCFFYIFHTVFH